MEWMMCDAVVVSDWRLECKREQTFEQTRCWIVLYTCIGFGTNLDFTASAEHRQLVEYKSRNRCACAIAAEWIQNWRFQEPNNGVCACQWNHTQVYEFCNWIVERKVGFFFLLSIERFLISVFSEHSARNLIWFVVERRRFTHKYWRRKKCKIVRSVVVFSQ